MCGASASTAASKCDHCGARLATISCPSCFGMMFLGAKFCSHCGARADREEEIEAVKADCPRCRTELREIVVGSTRLRECSRCEGVWVGKAAFEQICVDREKQAALLGLPFSIPTDLVGSVEPKIRYLPCPACSTLMNRINFANCSAVIVDVCREHGTWFDKDELRRIIEFIRAGGFDKARAVEIETLKAQRQKLEAARAAGSTNTDMRSGGGPGWAGGEYDLVEAVISGTVSLLKHWLH